MIDIVNEQMLPFSKIPAWCEQHLGNQVNRSTVHRWRTRGARGRRLETVLVGGRRYTSQKHSCSSLTVPRLQLTALIVLNAMLTSVSERLKTQRLT